MSVFLKYLDDAAALRDLILKQPGMADGFQDYRFLHGKIVFEHVSFDYKDGIRAITDVNLRIESAKHIAIVGESGSGKSTFLKLLYRCFDVSQGKITIDDQDLREVTLQSLHTVIAFESRPFKYFKESILELVRCGNPRASDEEIFQACRIAGVHEQIISFPDGYSTKIGKRGIFLSEGQLRRLEIAAMILQKPKFILLDGVLDAIDSDGSLLQTVLEKLPPETVIITVTHGYVLKCGILLSNCTDMTKALYCHGC